MRAKIRAMMNAPPGKRKRGRPWGSKTRGSPMIDDPLVPGNQIHFYPTISDIVFDVYMLLNAGVSPKEATKRIRDLHGVVVVEKSIERYRATAYNDRSQLTIYL
jgi:hypothetical protein